VVIDSFPEQVNLGNSASVCSGESITLKSPTTNISGYLWNTGSTDSLLVVNTTGSYHVTVTSNRGCQGIDTVLITVDGVAPLVGFSFDTVCLGQPTQFMDTSAEGEIGDPILSRHWDFNNEVFSTQTDTCIVFGTSGNQSACLTVSSTAGCESKACKEVLVKPLPSASFEIVQGNLQCLNTPVTFIDTNTHEGLLDFRLWDFGEGTTAAGDTANHTFSSQTDYTVQLTTSLNGCMDSSAQTLEIRSDIPMGELSLASPLDNLVHKSDSLTFGWGASENTINYQVLLSADNEFTTILVDTTNLTDTTIKLPVSILYDTLYWRAQAYNLCGDYIVSETRKLIQFPRSNRLSLWLDASKGVTLDDTLINNWQDQSPFQRHSFQNDNTIKPQYVPAYPALNNQPVLLFENDFLSLGNTLPIDSIRHLFMVLQHREFSNYSMFLSKGYTGDGSFSLGTNGNSAITKHFVDGSNFSGTNEIDNTRPSVFEAILKPEEGFVFNINQQEEINATTSLDFLGSNAYEFHIGNCPQTNSYYFNGYIAEIIIYDTLLTLEQEDQVYGYLRNKYSPALDLEATMDMGNFGDTSLNAFKPWFTSYTWSTGSTDSAITVSQPGTYHVTVTDIFGFTSSDSVTVTYPKPIQLNDTVICLGDTIVWSTSLDRINYTYEWRRASIENPITDSDANSIAITQEDHYHLVIRDLKGNPWYSDTIFIKVDSFPEIVSLGGDAELCIGNRIYIQDGVQAAESYLWSTGSTMDYIQLQVGGTYHVTVTDTLGCVGIDTATYTVKGVAPTPDFTFDNTCFNDQTLFTDISSVEDGQITSWEWEFGDNGEASGQNTKHQFASPGFYKVKLSISSDNGCNNLTYKDVQIYNLPNTYFVPNRGCTNTPVIFSDKSTSLDGNITAWQWEFPDGSMGSGNLTEHTFKNAGNEQVRLITTTNLGCKDSLVRDIDIQVGPVTDFSYSPPCNNNIVYFSDQSISLLHMPLQYSWFINGFQFSTLNNPKYLFPDTGRYVIQLFTKQNSNACQSNKVDTIHIIDNPKADFMEQQYCEKNPGVLIDKSTASMGNIKEWKWTIDSLGTKRVQNPLVKFTNNGKYNIHLQVEDQYGCIDTVSKTIQVASLPVPTFSMSDIIGPIPFEVEFLNSSTGASNYSWIFGDGDGSEEANPAHTYTDSGSYTIQLLAMSDEGCLDSVSKSISAIVSRYDIAVSEVSAEMENNFLTVRAKLFNYGTINLTETYLYFNTDRGETIREVIKDTLFSGKSMVYTFSTNLQVSGLNKPTYVCVLANIPNAVEENLDNNEECYTFDKTFLSYPPYPNPSEGEFTIEFILPVEDNVEILLFDLNGNELATLFKGEAKAGLNSYTYKIPALKGGTYVYKIMYSDKVKSYQIVFK
jgi:PKD repeat protein